MTWNLSNNIRSIEVRFADFQMNNAAALPLQFCSAAEHLKGSLAAHVVHALGDPVFRIELHPFDFLALKVA